MVDTDRYGVGQFLARRKSICRAQIQHQAYQIALGILLENRVEAFLAPFGHRLCIHKQTGRCDRQQTISIIDNDLARPAGQTLRRAHHRLAGSVVAAMADSTARLEHSLSVLPRHAVHLGLDRRRLDRGVRLVCDRVALLGAGGLRGDQCLDRGRAVGRRAFTSRAQNAQRHQKNRDSSERGSRHAHGISVSPMQDFRQRGRGERMPDSRGKLPPSRRISPRETAHNSGKIPVAGNTALRKPAVHWRPRACLLSRYVEAMP
jgi:hypothetical protein